MENFSVFFNEKLKERGLTLRKLSEESGITLKHLENLSQGDFGNMPSAPYLRGYLLRLGAILNFDGEACWASLVEKGLVKSSGGSDELPKNRFAHRSVTRKAALAALAAILLLYGATRLPYIIGKPRLYLIEPNAFAYNESAPLSTVEDSITIKGRAENANSVRINNDPVMLGNDNVFEKNIPLREGLNTIEITAKKFLGKETSLIRKVFYEPPAVSSATVSSTPSELLE